MYVTIRTDKPDAEIGLYDRQTQLRYIVWPAHRQLAETIHIKIRDMLVEQETGLSSIRGIIIFKGPGSFTGLRIGISVANAYATSLSVPIVGSKGDDWIADGIRRLVNDQNDGIVMPEYGSEARTTIQKK